MTKSSYYTKPTTTKLTMTTEIQLHITVSSGRQGSLPNNIIIDCGQLLGVIFVLNFLFHPQKNNLK